jgi:hypothetical protein
MHKSMRGTDAWKRVTVKQQLVTPQVRQEQGRGCEIACAEVGGDDDSISQATLFS